MANKDDEFDFEWDDDSSFDSELDKFDSDVDEYHPDELKDAKKDRNPVISKLKSIGPSIHDAGSAVLAGAGVGIAKTIERDMPEVHGVYTGATHAISEAQMLRNEVTDKVKPWWNDTKRVIRKLSQQLNGELPFGLDKKILKLIGEEDRDQEYKQPSKEDLRREQMNSNINSIFELQMQKSMEQQKDAILNRTLDRRVANIHHKESAGFLSKIAENAVFQHAFTSSVFTAYLKKDLELKYKHFYVAEDTLEVFKNHARAVDSKLDAVIKNTALPEADKIYMGERITGDLKKRFSEGFNEKLSNYFGKIRKNIVDKVKDAVDIGEILTSALSTQSEMLEYMNDEDSGMGEMMSMNSEPSIFTKKGLMHALLGRLGGFFGKRMLRKFTKNLPQETLETIQHYLRGGSNGIALLIDDIKQGRIEGVPDGIRELIYDFAPDLGRNNDPVIVNEGWHTLDKGGKITNKFIKTVEDVIPNYLAMQTRYLEIMATNTDSGIQKWNFKTLRMETEKERTEEMYQQITHTSDQGKARLQHGIIETSKLVEHTTAHYGALGETYKANLKKALRANAKDIEIFKINLAHSEKYYQVNGKEIVKELESIYKAKNVEELKKIELFNVGFQDIKAVKAVAGFWLDVLADRTSGSLRPNGAAVDHFNAQLLNEKAKASQLYRQVMEEAYKTGNYDIARKVLGATTTSAGDLKINARDLYVRELDTKATSGEIFNYNEKEVVKQFNEAFRNIKEDELHKNYFVEKFKDIIEKVKKINPTDFAEDMLESPFKAAYLKIYGKDKEKEADRAWKKFLSNVAKTTEFVKNEYDKATEAIDKALDKLKCRSLEEFFDALADVIDKDNSKAWRRLRDSVVIREDNGKTVRNLADLAPEEWYDFFGLLEDPASVAKLFDSGSSTATILRSLFPKDIQLLIYSINNDSTLVEKMKAINKQHNNNDAASVNLRQSKLKKLITESIDRTKQQIGERETSKIWKKSHFSVNRFNAADQARFKGLVNRRNAIDRDIQQVKHDISVGKSVLKNAEALQRDKEAIEEEILKMKRSQDPDFYGYDEEIKKSIAEKEKQRTSVSSDNFNGSSSINIGKQQLDILKSIDEQLGHFYHAFIDINFRNAELARMTDGRVTGDQGRYEIINKMQRWVDTLNDPNQAAWHELAQLQLEQNGFSSVEAYQSWLNGGRNDKLNDIKGQVAYDTLVNSNKIGTSTGVVYSSTAELDAKIDKMVKDLTENRGSKDNPEELRKQLRFDIIRGERRKHYIQLLKTLYKNDKNPFYNDLAQYIVKNENAFLNNVNATMPDEALYRWIIDSILSTDDDTRASTIKYLRILVVRSSSLTTFVERDDIKIGIIQEFLPRQAGHIFSMALDYIRETEASSTKSDSAVQTDARNLVGLAIGGSSYETVHQAQQDLESTRDQLDRQIYEIRHNNTGDEGDAVNFTADDVHKLEDAILQRNIVQDNLNTVNERVRNFENDRINSTYNHRNINADDHSLYINEMLTGNGDIDYAEAINFIEGVGRSKLRRQNAGNELATNALGEKVTSNKELISNREYNNMQKILDSVDAIRTNYSTKEDIREGDINTLKRMLTAIYQNINVTNETPDNRELWRIYHAITGNTSLSRRKPQQRFAKGGNFDINEHMQLDDAAQKYIEKIMSKPGGPTATELKKVEKLHAEALRRFVTRNPSMRNIAAEQYLNNGIPVLQWDPDKLSSLSPYDQQVGQILFNNFVRRGGREYMNAGGRAHGTSVKGKNANAVIEFGHDTPRGFDTLFTLDHESQHILDKRAGPYRYNVAKYAGKDHIGVGAPWEHYANLGAIKSQIGRGNIDQLIEMMQYLNETADDTINDNRYLAKQIRRMLHKAGVDTSAYNTVIKPGMHESDDGIENIIRQLCKQGRNPKNWDTVSSQEKIQMLYWLKSNKASLAGMGVNIADSSIDELIAKYSGSVKKHASGGNFDAEAEVQNYQNMYDKIARTTYGRDKDKAVNSLVETTLTGIEKYANIRDMYDEAKWLNDSNALESGADDAKWCIWLEWLLQKAPMLDKTDYYRQWLNIPDTVHVAAIHMKESTIRKYYPELDADFWKILTAAKNRFNNMCAVKDPRYKNSGYIIRRLTEADKKYKAIELFGILHELGHIVTERGTVYGVGNEAHKGRGHYTEKHADIYGLKRYIADLGPTGLSRVTDWLAWTASSAPEDKDFDKAKSNGSDGRWRADLMRRYMRMRKYKGDPLYTNLNDEFLKPQFRNNYAKGDNISFSLPIDQIGGYVDQPTEILGGSGIAGEAGGETIIPHKYNERFKELIYRCLRDTVGENMARKVLRMMKPSDTTKEKLGVNLPDTGYGMMFAKGGDLSGKRSRDEIKKRIESIDATLADHEENSNYRLDYIEQIRKEKADLENQLKVEDESKQKEEYTRQHPTDTIKGILLNIMESNEAIYRKMGDGLLVVDLAAMLDKLKNTQLLDKLKSLKIGEKIKNFIFGTYDKGKGIANRVYDFGKNVTKTVASNIGSFGRHMFTNKVCDVYLKSKIEGQVHGDLKIKSSELEHGTIFADPECTKPIYSVADIYPPVYRKVDKDGTETVEEAIREDEGKDGLVDVEGHSLVRFGGKVGRFLRHVATTPIKAILTHKNWERLKGLGTSIASGIGSGINGLLDAYCDVYTTKNLEKPLVYGESIKEGRLVRVLEGGKTKVVPTVFDIDGPCWLLIDDPDKPGERKLGNEVIKEEHITDGLCHKDGSPIESTKIAKAASMLRRAAGAIGNGLLSLTGGIFNAGSTVISWAWDKGKTAAKWVKDRVKDAFTAKNPYIDVCVIRDNEKKVVMHADELRTNKATHRYCFMDKDGKMTPVLSAYGIDAPVFDMRGSKIKDTDAYDHKPVEIITKDDVDNQAIYDTEGNRLTKWAGRSLAGKIGAAALGSVKFGWKAIKGLGKGLWNVGKTVLGGIGSLLGEGGAAVTSFFTKAWSSTLDFFKNSVISRKDLKELVGDRLLDIYGLLYKYMPRKKYNPNDKDGDGDVDGSWADYEQRRKDREAKREQDRLNQWYKDHPNAARGDDSSFMSKLKEAFLSGFGGGGGSSTGILDFILGASGLKTLFSGNGAGAAAGAGKTGLLKRLFSPITNLFATPNSNNGMRGGKLYNLRKKVAEFFVGNNETPDSGKFKRGILNVLRGYGIKAKNAAKGKASGAWSGIKDFFGRLSAERKIAALRSRIAAQHAQIMGRSAAGAATGAAGKGFLSKLFGGKLLSSLGTKFGARLAAAGAANAAPPVIGQIVSAGLLLWTAYDVVKHFATDSTKVKGLRPIRLKAYGVGVKYWEAIEDLETDTFSEFKSGNGEGVDTDRLKKFGYKIDFLDAGEMAYGGDKLEYIRTWYKLKFVPFYQKYVQSLILACKLDPKEQPKGDDIPDQLYPTIVLELTQGFKKVNVGPLKDLNLNKASYEKWLARKREKDREEGLSAGKYSNKDLADRSLSDYVTKFGGNASDHLAYAWNELKHGNLLNATWGLVKSAGVGVAKIAATAAEYVVKLHWAGLIVGVAAAFIGGKSKNEKAWDEIRMKLYGLDKTTTNAKEYERIVSLIKDFEVRQLHVIDGEEQMVEDDLRELAEEIFTEKVRSKIKFRLNSSGIPIIDTSKDLSSESRSFVISWYKRIFLPIFGLYANMVRMSYGDGPGDNIVIDNVPEDQRAELLKEYEREAKKMLDKNIDTEILRLSPEGFYDYLIMRSEEDIAELSKDSEGMVKEDDLSYGDKLSRSLDDAGNDLSKAWALKFKNPGKALGLAAKGIGKAAWGVVKTTVTSITSSIVDLLVGSANEHRWETRFIDYGFTSREGSSDYFKNNNLRSMEEFENEAGRQLLEDNTGKPDEEYFVKIALNSGFIENCCQKIFNSGSGIDGLSLAATNMGNIFSLWNPVTWGLAATERVMNRSFGIRSLSELKEKLVDYLVSNAKDNADLEKTELSIKTKVADMINYLDFWWTIRFKPVFDAFISVVTAYGVEPDDIDVDDIPQESRDEAFEAYKKASAIALKKDRAAMYTLSAEGCALYLEKVEEYREDAKDGTIDNSGNPLAKFYKEKEKQFEDNVVAAVVANAPALDNVEKARVAKALSKASVEIDSELNDVNTMAKYAAKDILDQLGVKDLLNKNHTPKESIYGILMKLTMGENHYDKIANGSGWIFDDSLGKLFTEFVDNAHECLYGTDADKLADYLKEFAESCLQSDLFIFNTPKGGKVKFENIPQLNAWIDSAYRNLGGGDHTAIYFGNWFAYRFMPYYAYFVTLVNKANDKQDLKEKPDVDDLTVMRRNYVIDKLAKSENKGLISGKAKAMKIDANSFYKFFEKLNETEGNDKVRRAELRSNGRKFLEEQMKDVERQLAEDRAKRKASNKPKEDIKRDVEEKDLANVDAISTVKPGTRVGDNKAKRKGRSCTDAERQYIYNFLTSELGLTPEQAAAVMGNMMQESSMSPDVINSIGATGLFQWLGYRVNGGRGYKGLIPFAKENGLDPYSVEAQMKYLKWELENVPYEKGRFDKYVRSIVTDPKNPNKTVAQCAVGFRVGFERCGEHEAQDSKRVGYAKEFYRKFGPDQIPSYIPDTTTLDTAPNDSTGTTGAMTNTQLTGSVNNTATGLPQHIVRYEPLKDDEQELTDMANSVVTEDTTAMGDKLREVADVKSGVNIKTMHPVLKDRFAAMSKAFTEIVGHRPLITSGARTMAQQAALKKKYGKGAASPNPYAPHISGLALDASSQDMNKAEELGLLKKFGLHRPLKDWGTKKEPWHVEIAESRSFGGGIINQKSIDYANSLIKKGNTSPNGAIAPSGIVAPTKDDVTENSETAVAQQNKDVINSAKTTKRNKAMPAPSGDAKRTKATSLTAKVRNKINQSMNDATAQASANIRASQRTVEQPTPASVISNTSTEGNNDNIRTLSAMQTDITNANSGNAPVISELKVISSILAAFKGDVSGFIKLITTNAGLTKTNTANKSTAEIATDKNISDEKLNILIDKLNELAQLISTSGNPSTAKVPQKYHVRDNYMQGYPLQANKVNS